MTNKKLKQQNSTSRRAIFIDFLKGIGILQFIIWHIFENFFIGEVESSCLFRVVFFVTGLFVFLSGFLVGFHYKNKVVSGNFKEVFRRLYIRAGKIFGLVVIVNILYPLVCGSGLPGAFNSICNLISLLYVDRWDVSFQVLIAISATLLFGAPFVYFLCNHVSLRKQCIVFFIFMLVVSVSMEIFFVDRIPYLWRYLGHGLFGVFIGVYFDKIDNINKEFIKLVWLFSVFVMVVVEYFVFFDKEVYHFFLYNFIPSLVFVLSYFISVGGYLYNKFDLSNNSVGPFGRVFVTVGRESLFIYILQIAIIDVIVLGSNKLATYSQFYCFVYAIIIFIVCFYACNLLVFLRKTYFIDSAYRMLFR